MEWNYKFCNLHVCICKIERKTSIDSPYLILKDTIAVMESFGIISFFSFNAFGKMIDLLNVIA